MYLNLLLVLTALLLAPDMRERLARLRRSAVFWPVMLMLGWTLVAAAAGAWLPDTQTRLFHALRVALVLGMGVMLEPREARAALAGFLIAAVMAAMIVAVHHVWGLPAWTIWASLLTSRNNFSSGNMITMATAAGIWFYIGIAAGLARQDAWLALATAAALALTVALHAVSRNAQLLLILLLLSAVLCRFRSWRAAVSGLLVMLAAVALAWQFSPTTKSRFLELATNIQAATVDGSYTSSGGVRWRMYQEALQEMGDHPVLGAGVGSWLPHWNQVWMGLDHKVPQEVRLQFATINNPHNDFLLAGMETGVAGLLILAWLLVRFVRAGWHGRSAAGGVTVLMGVSVFATSLVNAPFRDAALGMTLLWLLGASLAAQQRTTDE